MLDELELPEFEWVAGRLNKTVNHGIMHNAGEKITVLTLS